PERAAGTARARRMGAAFNRVMAVVDAVDLVAKTIDLYALTRDLQASRQGEVWTVDATDNTVNLEPREARVAQGSSIELTVHVPDAEDGALLEYRYATSSNLGTLTTTRGNGSTIEGDALTTTTANVTFTADGGGSGVAAVIVEVFDARMSDRPLIGQAQSLVEVTEEIRGRGSLTVVMDAQNQEACAEVGRYAGLLWFYTCPDLGTPDLRMEARCTDDGAACPVGSEGVVMGSGPPFIDETAEWAHFVERYGPLADGTHWLLWGGQGNSGCSDEPPAELTAEVDCFGYDDGVDFTPVSCAELEQFFPNAVNFELECRELVAPLDHSLHGSPCADMLELLQNSGLCR
ncbi:MAG: hypothetical protein OXT09_02015, partial [Myxococcales bacterium]|nr:hypothetical protein [Myxococcales bacterium]